MTPQRIVSALLLAVPMVSGSTTYEGYGTVYTLSSPSDGNCNFMNAPADAATKYAALNADQWDDTMNCGRCAEVACTDASCSGQSSEVVYIMDQCPGCSYGDLDLSPDVFESITGQSYTKLSIEWKFVDCPISDNVQYCLKTGSSEFWVAVQPTNFVSGVQSLSINGQETSVIDSAYYFLIDGSGESVADLSSVSISLTGVNGEVLEETLSLTADECTDGSKQFSSSGHDTQTTTQVSTATSAPSTAAPSPVPSTAAPTPVLSTAAPTPVPSTAVPTPVPSTAAPTPVPSSAAPTPEPTTSTPIPSTAAPTPEPTTEPPTTAPVTDTPTTAPPTPTPTLSPVRNVTVVDSASTGSDGTTSASSSSDQTKSSEAPTALTNSFSTSSVQESESASAASEQSSASKTKVSSSTSAQTSTAAQSAPTPTSTPIATEASVQEEAASSGGLHSTAAIVGLVAAVCVALGAAVGVAMVVHKKRKLLEESKDAVDRDSFASYTSIRTPRSEVPVMHSAV